MYDGRKKGGVSYWRCVNVRTPLPEKDWVVGLAVLQPKKKKVGGGGEKQLRREKATCLTPLFVFSGG